MEFPRLTCSQRDDPFDSACLLISKGPQNVQKFGLRQHCLEKGKLSCCPPSDVSVIQSEHQSQRERSAISRKRRLLALRLTSSSSLDVFVRRKEAIDRRNCALLSFFLRLLLVNKSSLIRISNHRKDGVTL